jgi:hypothetical protein
MVLPSGRIDTAGGSAGRRIMRRNIRDDVLAEHLLRVRARREDLRRVLSGGAALVVPTLREKQAFQEEYSRLAPIEAALAERLPPRREAGERRLAPRVEAAVLTRERELAATAAVPLLQREELPDEQERALERALALFDHCTAELQRIADDADALREARLLEGRLPSRRVGDGGMRSFIGVGGWSMLIGGWW